MTLIWGSYRDALQAEFAQACDQALGPLVDPWIVTYGFRTYAEQATLYARGRDADGTVVDPNLVVTDAKPGTSAHELGLAIDVALNLPTGPSWNYSRPEWQSVWAAVRAAPILHSGMDFPGWKDPPHIERLDYWQFAPPSPERQT